MAAFNCGDVVVHKNHSDGEFQKDRWVVVSGLYNRYGQNYYILFYCTSSPNSFPNATIGCNLKTEDHCFVFEPSDGEFIYKTYISFLEPVNYGLEFMVNEFDNHNNELKFNLGKHLINFLSCASNSKTLKNYIINSINNSLQNLQES